MGEKQVSYREARSAARLAVYVAVFVAIVAVGIVLPEFRRSGAHDGPEKGV